MATSSKLMTEWLHSPGAEDFVARKVDQFVAAMPPVRALQADLAFTNTRLVDWLDHLALADGAETQKQLAGLGFELDQVAAEPGDSVYYHPRALLPRVLLRAETGAAPGDVVAMAVQVENVSEFLEARQAGAMVEGTPFGPYRRAGVWRWNGREFLAVERRGHRGFIPLRMPPDYPLRYLHAFERWDTRPRQFDDVHSGMAQTLALARTLVREMGSGMAAWIALAAEHTYWQRRSRPRHTRLDHQDRLGMGWLNRNHYTFRSSRATFGALAQVLEALGFRPHARFHAGAEVGWGAQVLEQPACRVTVLVDLAPDEVAGDSEPRLDLWCTLHGESMLIAGLHHFIDRFVPVQTAGLMAEWDVKMMTPFASVRRTMAQEQGWRAN
jgi:hypothetical protein